MTSQRFASFSVMRTSSSPRGEVPRYVSPTYKSSVFNHTEGDETAPVRSIRTYQSFNRLSEDFAKSFSGGWHTTKANHVLPTVSEWVPQRKHVNDAEVYDRIEAEALAHSKNKSEQLVMEMKERKAHRNREYNETLQQLEQKHASRLDHKKPKEDDKRAFREVRDNHVDDMMEARRKQANQNKNLLKTLDQQIEEKIRKKQIEIQREQNDLRNGIEMKARKEYDVDAHKNVLKQQIEEKQQRKMQIEQAKEKEKNDRIKNIQQQEAMWTDYRNKLAARQVQSPGGAQNQQVDVYKVDLQDHNKKQKRVEENPERSNNWEAVSKALLKRKEQQDEYLKDVKVQMLEQKRRKTAHTLNDRQEDRKHIGLKLTQQQPKESIAQVTEILKKQLAEKEKIRNGQKNAKHEEKVQAISLHKTGEIEIRQKYSEIKQQKSELLAHYKNAMSESASKKQHKGLTTVKI